MHVRVWPPQPSDLAPWACRVEVTRLFSPAKCIYGADSWQAQVPAMQFAATVLQNFVARGGALFWPDNGAGQPREPFHCVDLLPSLP